MLNIALPKGRLGEKVYAMFAGAGFECPAIREEKARINGAVVLLNCLKVCPEIPGKRIVDFVLDAFQK